MQKPTNNTANAHFTFTILAYEYKWDGFKQLQYWHSNTASQFLHKNKKAKQKHGKNNYAIFSWEHVGMLVMSFTFVPASIWQY